MLVLEFVLHALMDLVLWVGGRSLDRVRAARRVAAYRRGEPVTLRCRYRVRPGGRSTHPARLTLSRTGASLDAAGARGLALSGPTGAAIGGGRGGTVLTCTATGADGTPREAELALLTWDAELVSAVEEAVAAPR
ncbi:hypothetical protein [Streptomyces sp. DH12]|uniref:hypothetical protein n=1 Tax=Streptomyces sp. DH12 TaxID=2857010 RepID=UPI001E317AD5|nr:hypothetical protein [Streptomyces sp. DH12]